MTYAIVFFGSCSVILGTLFALRQKKRIKRLLAYSSVTHVGFILLSLASNSIEGLVGVIFYLISYLVTLMLFWSILFFVINWNFTSELKINRIKERTQVIFINFSIFRPLLALSALCSLLSFCGMPPFIGFFAKFLVFSSLTGFSRLLTLVIILLSVVSCFYYIRLIKMMYFEKVTTYRFKFFGL